MDWSDQNSVIDYLTGYARMLAGSERPVDRASLRELVRRDVERARNIASSENHGQALADEIPGARLLPLDGAGHGVERADWETIARAVLGHTAAQS